MLLCCCGGGGRDCHEAEGGLHHPQEHQGTQDDSHWAPDCEVRAREEVGRARAWQRRGARHATANEAAN